MKERKGGEEVGGKGGRWGGDYFLLLQYQFCGGCSHAPLYDSFSPTTNHNLYI